MEQSCLNLSEISPAYLWASKACIRSRVVSTHPGQRERHIASSTIRVDSSVIKVDVQAKPNIIIIACVILNSNVYV